MSTKKLAVLARLTLNYKAGHKLVVEVRPNPDFYSFYEWHRIEKGRRSKRFLRGESRDRVRPDLEAVRARALRSFGQEIASTSLVIYQKRAYRLACQRPANELTGGLTHLPPACSPPREGFRHGQRPVHIPARGYTPLSQRFKILTKGN